MKKTSLILMSFVLYFCAFAQDVITFEWEAGTEEKSFQIYYHSNYGFTVNWGDDSNIDTYSGINGIFPSHSYANAGTYTVSIIANTVNCRLGRLYCSDNQINSLDVSDATALTHLECQNNQLKSLDLNTNTVLWKLDCSNNPQLNNLFISHSNSLEILYANNCTALEELDCSNNLIRVLWLNGCTALKYLDCSYNKIVETQFSFSNSPLEYLDCSHNQITLFPFGTETLTTLYCNNNGDIYGGTVFLYLILSTSPSLETLDCSSNILRELDLSNNPALEYLKCDNSHLSNLNISNNAELQYLYCNDNYINDLDLSNNQALTKIECYNNKLLLSKLYDISEMITDKNNKLLGTQNVEFPSAIIGVPFFTDQAEFNDIFTSYTVTSRLYPYDPDYYPVPESYYTVINGRITFNNIGNYLVKLTNDAIFSYDDYPAEMIVYLSVISGVGINENSISNIEIFPNPTSGEFNVRTANLGIENIQIFDVMGKKVWEESEKLQIEKEMTIDISHFLSGVYFVKMGEVVKKIIKE